MLDLTSKKLIFLLLLTVVGAGAFGTFAELETNVLLKGYGLILVLQAGFALVYLGYYRRRREF